MKIQIVKINPTNGNEFYVIRILIKCLFWAKEGYFKGFDKEKVSTIDELFDFCVNPNKAISYSDIATIGLQTYDKLHEASKDIELLKIYKHKKPMEVIISEPFKKP